jgi:hypothetical protein
MGQKKVLVRSRHDEMAKEKENRGWGRTRPEEDVSKSFDGE